MKTSESLTINTRALASWSCATLLALLALLPPQALARDAARDLSRMIGYTIVAAGTVKEATSARDGGTLIILDTGAIFKITDPILPPLPLTDAVLFAKPPSKEILEKFGGKLPAVQLNLYKLLIDNEAHDATIVRQ